MTLAVELQNVISVSECPTNAEIQEWIELTLNTVSYKKNAEVTVRIVDEVESQSLNYSYRQKNKPTNILSFPFEVPEQVKCDLLGDLVICHSIVEQEAIQQSKPLKDHYTHMLIHGTLHLLGFDHIEDDEAEEMEAIEVEILALLGVAEPY